MQVVEQNNIIITWWSASHESMLDLTLKVCTSILLFIIYITLHLQQNNAKCLSETARGKLLVNETKKSTWSKYCRGPFETPEMTDHQSEFLQITSLISSPPSTPPLDISPTKTPCSI